MRIGILIAAPDRDDETQEDRSRVSVSAVPSKIPALAITGWYPSYGRGGRQWYTLTHLSTGRCLSKVPLTFERAQALEGELMRCDIDWDYLQPGPSAWMLFSPAARDIAQHG